MEVNTGTFTALTDQVAALEAEVAGVRHILAGEGAEAAAIRDSLVEMGRALERHEQAERAERQRLRRPRLSYLQVLGGGAS
jgi:hypothetical protein